MLNIPLHVAVLLVVFMVKRCCSVQMVGSCTFQDYLEKARECTTSFIRDLQSNTSAECSILYKKMIDCTKDSIRECMRGRMQEDTMEALLNESSNQLNTEAFYCKDGLFSTPRLIDAPKNSNHCKKEFYNETMACGEIFQTKFRRDKADESLCREFASAKSCLKASVTKHCQLTEGAKELLISAFDEYNPFCNINIPLQSQDQEYGSPPQNEEGWLLNPQSNEQELDTIGQCSITSQLNRTRKCITLFVRSLQDDPLGNCSIKYTVMQDCIVSMLRSCLSGYGITSESDIQVEIENTRNQTSPEEFYCKGLLEAPKVSSDNQGLNCQDDFFERELDCLKNFNDTFTTNASDSSLCGKFSAAKHCLRDLITNNCSGNSRHPSFEIALVFDEYNPFCPGSKDLADDGTVPPVREVFDDPCLVESPASSFQRSKEALLQSQLLPALLLQFLAMGLLEILYFSK